MDLMQLKEGGYIYCLVNSMYPGVCKVGITRSPIGKRMKELFGTGVPVPFSCYALKHVLDPNRIEAHFMQAFAPVRFEGREFYRIDPCIVQCVFDLFPGTWSIRDCVALDEASHSMMHIELSSNEAT
jgi:hypothetical protein